MNCLSLYRVTARPSVHTFVFAYFLLISYIYIFIFTMDLASLLSLTIRRHCLAD